MTTSSGSSSGASNAPRLDTYIQDAQRDGDPELAEFFQRAQNESRKGRRAGEDAAQQATRLLIG